MKILILPALAIAALALAMAAPGGADAKCWPGRTSDDRYHWAGMKGGGNGIVYNAQAEVWNYDPWVENGELSTAWVMLTRNDGGWGFVQVGWWEYAFDYRYTFLEWTYGAEPDRRFFRHFMSPMPENAWSTYMLTYLPATSQVEFRVSASLVGKVGINFVPDRTDMSAEISDINSQMAGGWAANYEWFRNAWIKAGNPAQWLGFPSHSIVWPPEWSGSPYYASVYVDSLRFVTYDKYCPN